MKFGSIALASLLSTYVAAEDAPTVPRGKCNFDVETYSDSECKTKLDPTTSKSAEDVVGQWKYMFTNMNDKCQPAYDGSFTRDSCDANAFYVAFFVDDQCTKVK